MAAKVSPIGSGQDISAGHGRGGQVRTSVRVRVRYPECDPMGMAHHSVYPVWMELARTEHLREHGVPYRVLEEQGVHFVVAKIAVRFRRPVRYDQELTVSVWEDHGGVKAGRDKSRIKVDHLYEMVVGDQVVATGSSTLVCVDKAGATRAIPDGAVG